MPKIHPTTRVYLLIDPRDQGSAYIGIASAPERLGRPCVAPNSPAAQWLAELQSLNMEPVVSFDGLPTTAMPKAAAKWVAADMAKVLNARGVRVMTGSARRAH